MYVGTDQSFQQQQPQALAHNNYAGYNPEARNSLTSLSSAADQGEGEEDDEEDDEEEVDAPSGSNFDYFGAAQQQKVRGDMYFFSFF